MNFRFAIYYFRLVKLAHGLGQLLDQTAAQNNQAQKSPTAQARCQKDKGRRSPEILSLAAATAQPETHERGIRQNQGNNPPPELLLRKGAPTFSQNGAKRVSPRAHLTYSASRGLPPATVGLKHSGSSPPQCRALQLSGVITQENSAGRKRVRAGGTP